MKKMIKLVVVVLLQFLLIDAQAQYSPNIVYPSGGGATQEYYPFDGSYGFSYNTSIYNKSNIGVSGNLTEIGYYVATPCSDSVMVTIKLEELNNSEFGGYDTWGGVSTNGFQVFQQKVAFTSMGFYFFDLEVPYYYDSTYNLGVYISCAWGGTGPVSPPKFACTTVDSGTDFVNMAWGQDNSFPISQLSQLTNHLPYVALKFNAPTPAVISSLLTDCDESELFCIAIGSTDKVLVATNNSGTFGEPGCGLTYTAGDTLSDGSEIIYAGDDITFNHTGLLPATMNYYKIWSYDTYKIYSETGNETSLLSNYNIPYTTNFDGGSGLPNGFSGGWAVMPDHGETDQGITAELTPSVTVKHANSPYFCGLTTNSKFVFDYRIVNISGYPNTGTPAADIDSINIKMLDPVSGTYSAIYSINPSNHIASNDFTHVEIPIGAYSGGLTKMIISAYSGTGSYFVDIDNFAITDPSGIADNTENSLNIYPNPANNVLNVVVNEAGQINIFDITGQTMLQMESAGNETRSIDIRGLNSGLYLIQSTNGTAARFIKE